MTSPIVSDLQIDSTNYNDGVMNLLKLVKPAWHWDNVVLKKINQGILNQLIRCHLHSEDNHDQCVVVRIFAPETIADRQMEIAGLQVGTKLGISPPLLAVFTNGIVMGYVKGKSIGYQDFSNPKFMRLATRKIAQIHTLSNADSLQLVDKNGTPFKLKTENVFKRTVLNSYHSLPEQFESSLQNKIPSKAELWTELQDIFSILDELDLHVCLSHGDFQHTNIMYDESTGDMRFVDFEFFGYNYRAREFALIYCYEMLVSFGLITERDTPLVFEKISRDLVTLYMEAVADITQMGKDDMLYETEKMIMEEKLFRRPFMFLCVMFAFFYIGNEHLESLGINTRETGIKAWECYTKCKDNFDQIKETYIKTYHLP